MVCGHFGLLLGFSRELAQLHEVVHARVAQLKGPLDLLELLFVTLPLLGQLRLDDLVRLSHLHRLVVLDHYFIETITQALDLTRHGMIIVIVHVGSRIGLLRLLLELIELLALCRRLCFQVIKLATFVGHFFLSILLASSRTFVQLIFSHELLFANILLKGCILLFQVL